MNVRHAVLGGAGLVLAMLAGCGITAEDSARPLPSPPVRFPLTASPFPVQQATTAATQRIFLIRDDGLVPVTRPVQATSVSDLMAQLLAGPSDAERSTGLTSALPGTDITAAVRVDGSQAIVEMSTDPAGGQTGRNDEVLAIAQVVCTLTDRPDIATVIFYRDGHPAPMLRGDGSIAYEPLTAADYASLTR